VTFENPYALLALAALPLLVLVFVLRERRRGRITARFASPALLPTVAPRPSRRRRYLPLAVLLAALAAMVVGVARPEATISVKREEATVVIALDISRSMRANDVLPSRIAAARAAATSFLDTIPERFRVGVVAVGTRAVVSAPPTENRQLVLDALNILRPSQGTALGDAVVVAAELGQRERGEDGVVPPTAVLLISDGARDGGETDPADAAARAKKLGVPVYAILVGTADGTIEEELEGGYRQIIRVPADPQTLRQITSTTGGKLFTALDDEGLSAVYDNLDSRLGHREERRELTDFVAGGAAFLLLSGGALALVYSRRVPL
jgi:Ca-activated chloride channel homolog